ncbi:MAG: flagellar biosynthesis protein FliQ [Acidobacteriota bacterium]|jgi:flagellar biosynthetic protein FliQ|nr:flagellar biosynthesis protein FliQ [Acidobacteriota bacterium]
MNQEMVLQLAKDALQVTLWVCGPMLAASLVIGILISVIQVVTSIQDMTLTFVPKVIAVFVVFLVTFPWIMHTMIAYAAQLFGHLENFAK